MSVCTCMFVYDIGTCSCMCAFADTCVGAHMPRTETDLCVFLNCFPSCSFEQGLSQTGWLISSKDPHDSEPPVIGPVSQFLCGCWGSKSGPHACGAGCLPSLQHSRYNTESGVRLLGFSPTSSNLCDLGKVDLPATRLVSFSLK